MKKAIAFLFVLVLGMSTIGFAKHGKCGCKWDEAKVEKKIQKKVKKLTKKLSLSEAQASQMEAAIRKKMDAKKALKEEFYEKKKGLRETFRADVKGILNADQQAQFEKMKRKCCKKGSR